MDPSTPHATAKYTRSTKLPSGATGDGRMRRPVQLPRKNLCGQKTVVGTKTRTSAPSPRRIQITPLASKTDTRACDMNSPTCGDRNPESTHPVGASTCNDSTSPCRNKSIKQESVFERLYRSATAASIGQKVSLKERQAVPRETLARQRGGAISSPTITRTKTRVVCYPTNRSKSTAVCSSKRLTWEKPKTSNAGDDSSITTPTNNGREFLSVVDMKIPTTPERTPESAYSLSSSSHVVESVTETPDSCCTQYDPSSPPTTVCASKGLSSSLHDSFQFSTGTTKSLSFDLSSTQNDENDQDDSNNVVESVTKTPDLFSSPYDPSSPPTTVCGSKGLSSSSHDSFQFSNGIMESLSIDSSLAPNDENDQVDSTDFVESLTETPDLFSSPYDSSSAPTTVCAPKGLSSSSHNSFQFSNGIMESLSIDLSSIQKDENDQDDSNHFVESVTETPDLCSSQYDPSSPPTTVCVSNEHTSRPSQSLLLPMSPGDSSVRYKGLWRMTYTDGNDHDGGKSDIPTKRVLRSLYLRSMSNTLYDFGMGTVDEQTVATEIITALFFRDYDPSNRAWTVEDAVIVLGNRIQSEYKVHKVAKGWANRERKSCRAAARGCVRFYHDRREIRVQGYRFVDSDLNDTMS